MTDPSFSAEDAVTAQKDLRRALGLPPEAFPLPAFIGMISDEIEQFLVAGRSYGDIAARIAASTGKVIDAALIERYYAPPEQRRWPE